MIKQRKIELLAPAKNLECGIEAINHGADAVYIGAPKFGARAAAVNSLEDIEALVQYAHLYNARIYVTVNTILKEEELKETEEMIHALYRIGRTDCSGYGNHETESPPDTSPCQYADGQPYSGKGAISLGGRFPTSRFGARIIIA